MLTHTSRRSAGFGTFTNGRRTTKDEARAPIPVTVGTHPSEGSTDWEWSATWKSDNQLSAAVEWT